MQPRLTCPSEDPHRAGNVGGGNRHMTPEDHEKKPFHPVRCSCGRWVANSQEPEEDTTQVTCAKCRRHAQVREFRLRLFERIRRRA